LAESDPEIERLKGINEDRPLEQLGFESNWLVKVIGDTQVFNLIGKEEGGSTCYGTVTIKNLTWPGSICVAQTAGWANIYVGYGLKLIQSPFIPLQPNDIEIDQDDNDEYPEPNPKNPPEVIEPDSDNEKK